MSIKTWSGAALGLALCTTALTACSVQDTSNQNASAPASPEIDDAWKSDTEKQLRDAIATAPANGLNPDLFLKGGEKGAALTQAALKYASALANGYADPNKLHDVYTLPHEKVDVRQGLQQALQKGDVKGWLATLPPQTDEYRALGEAYIHFGQLASKVKYQPIPDGKPIKPGQSDPRMPQIVAALSGVGYLPAAPEPKPGAQPAAASTTYSPNLVTAVKKVQGDFGFKQDGVIGGDTLDAVNADPAYRAREIAVAMERLRWLQRTPPATRIDVNTASAVLQYWRDGKLVDTRNVVVGEHDKPTPQLQAPIFRLVAKPTWTVPKGIGDKELATKGEQWLKDNDFTINKDGFYVQGSGDKNSLGLVKFDMADDQQIYLHDTPAKALFNLPERHRSHGCVRVQNAVQFATVLAADEGIQDEFQQAMQNDTDQNFVQMPKKLPVRLLYHTVFWDGSAVKFRPDLYGWDENIARAIGLAQGPPHKIRQPQSSDDIGP